MTTVEWHDLLGRPFRKPRSTSSGLNCFDVAAEITRRIYGDPAGLVHPCSSLEEGDSWFEATRFNENWELVGRGLSSATQVGDIVGCGKSGILTTVYTRIERLRPTFLTSAVRGGVVAVPASKITDVIGVYRRRGA